MSQLVSTDPWTQVYDRLAGALKDRYASAQIVRLMNVIDYSGSVSDPTKDQLATADTPQVSLSQAGFGFGSFGPGTTSMSTTITGVYRLMLVSEDLRIDSANQIIWESCRAIYALGPRLGLVDASEAAVGQFVDGWRIQSGRQEAAVIDRVKRWQVLLEIVVDMRWPRGAIT